ncbi:MAG: hypothetical protein ACYC7D_07755 [Nitrososphaerales archaeon]
MKESRDKAAEMVAQSFRSATDELRIALADVSKMRDIELLWRIYSKVEAAVGVGKYVIAQEDRIGRFSEMVALKANDPKALPDTELKKILLECESDLDYAQYDFEVNGGSSKGLDAGRKARDSIKKLLLGHRKAVQSESRKTHRKKI